MEEMEFSVPCLFGLEGLAGDELRRLDIQNVRVENGRVLFAGDMELLARKTVQELEGDEGQEHLDEYADASTQRGACMLQSICKTLGFDSLGYQSLDGLLEAIGIDRDQICTYCWTGKE